MNGWVDVWIHDGRTDDLIDQSSDHPLAQPIDRLIAPSTNRLINFLIHLQSKTVQNYSGTLHNRTKIFGCQPCEMQRDLNSDFEI